MLNSNKLKLTLVDDDAQMSEMLKDFFSGRFPSSVISSYPTGELALQGMFEAPDLIVLDYHLDSADPAAMNGLQVLKKIKEQFPDVPVIFLSGQEKAEIAANTMKYGAYDYVVKNESAFHRLDILTNNILGHAHLKKNLGAQKFFNRLLALLVLALIVGMIVNKIIG